MKLDHASLKAMQRETRDRFSPNLSLRVHRSISWYGRAEAETEDNDARFIFLWIAFNAAYAKELYDRSLFSEKGLFEQFIQRLVDLDENKLLYNTVWVEFPKSIRALIDNRYIFQPFWDYNNNPGSEIDWKKAFEKSNAAALHALSTMDTTKILMIVLTRLYTLRNQLIHGGATWDSQVNRNQVRDGANILLKLVPAMIWVMMNNSKHDWGEACYPVVD